MDRSFNLEPILVILLVNINLYVIGYRINYVLRCLYIADNTIYVPTILSSYLLNYIP